MIKNVVMSQNIPNTLQKENYKSKTTKVIKL